MSGRRLVISTALLLALVLALGLITAPWLLGIDGVRRRLAQELSRATGTEIAFSRVEFAWLPRPAFRVRDIDMRSAAATVTVPELVAYPAIGILTGNGRLLRRLELVSPRVILGETGKPAAVAFPVLPVAATTVRRAVLEIPRIEGWTSSPIRITGLDMEIRERGGSMSVKIRSNGGPARSLRASLFLDRRTGRMHGSFAAKRLNPALMAPRALEGRIRLLNAPVDLSGSFESNGKGLDIKAGGTFPCFLYQGGKTAVAIKCGTAEFNVHHDEHVTRIEIGRLELAHPAMSLHGSVTRRSRDGRTRWRLDLAGGGIDLGATRKILLTLWPDHHVVKTLSDTISGGRAAEVTFFFDGPAERITRLEDMRIGARVSGADIHPPHTQLFLTDVSGAIRIEDGYLTGGNLAASLGNSRGTKGNLRMDLLKRDRAFALGMDLDADLSALPSVLAGLVKNKKFQDELARFSGVSGRGRARLEISGRLPHPVVEVHVNGFDVSATYGRLPWPVRLHGGRLDVLPGKVLWREVGGTAGPHHVLTSAGEVRWGGGTSLVLTGTTLRLDGGDLLGQIARLAGRDKVGKVLDSLSGPVEVSGLGLEGDPARPSTWRYHMRVAAKGLRWHSPLLPGEYLAEDIRARIDDHAIRIDRARIWHSTAPLTLTARVEHRFLRPGDLSLELDGALGGDMAKWVAAHGWLPMGMVPAAPLFLRGFRVRRKGGLLTVAGGISAPGGKQAPAADLDIEVSRDTVAVKKLVIRGYGGRIRLGLRHRRDKGATDIDWDGSLDGRSIAGLIAAPRIDIGRAVGRGGAAMRTGALPLLRGTISLTGLTLPTKDASPLVIETAQRRGSKDGELKIDRLQLRHGGKKLQVSGWIDPRSTPPAFEISAAGGELSTKDLDAIRKALPKGDGKGADGDFRFSFKRLYDIDGPVAGKGLAMEPARGEVRIRQGKWQAIKISDSRLCGLAFDGIFHPPEARLDSSFNLYSRDGEVSAFGAVLPCLGFKNGVVNGTVSVDANISGRPGAWRSGRLNLYSRKGVIHRLSLLSKALGLLNITGIISGSLIGDMNKTGFAYSELEVKSHVAANHLIVDKAVVRGDGLNIFASGDIDIDERRCDLVMLLAPLKTIDTILGNLPIIGRALGGRDTAIIAVPVKLTGRIDDPEAKILPAKEVGEGIVNFITRTIKLPLAIFAPFTNRPQALRPEKASPIQQREK